MSKAPDGPYSVHEYKYNGETWWHVSRPTAVYVETEYKTQYSKCKAQAVCDALNRYELREEKRWA